MTFAEEFARNQGKAIDVDGRPVVPMLRRDVRPGDRVRVVWRSSIDSPVQGIRIKLHGGSLTGEGKELTDVVLWRDTAPQESTMICNAKRSAELRVWNCWRDDHGVMQAWVGNAGMQIVHATDDKLTVRCNSRPEVTFEDLVFDLVLDRGA
jgi:hypothetical protein